MKYIYFQRIRLLKNKIAAELRINTKYQHQNEYIEEMQSPFVKEDGVLMLRLPEVVILSLIHI